MGELTEGQARRAARAKKLLGWVDPSGATGITSVYANGKGRAARQLKVNRDVEANRLAAQRLAEQQETNRLLREQLDRG